MSVCPSHRPPSVRLAAARAPRRTVREGHGRPWKGASPGEMAYLLEHHDAARTHHLPNRIARCSRRATSAWGHGEGGV